MLHRRHQWELFGMIDFEVVGVEVRLDGRLGRRFRFDIGLATTATNQQV
jgi:hypothetical protein